MGMIALTAMIPGFGRTGFGRDKIYPADLYPAGNDKTSWTSHWFKR